MKLTLIEISHNGDSFLSMWLNSRLFKSDSDASMYDWTKGFESGLEYADTDYEKTFLSFRAESKEIFRDMCEVNRATPLEEYVSKIENAGLAEIEQ